MLRLRRGVQRNLPGSPQVMSVGAPFRRPTLDVLDDGGRLAVAPRKRHHRDGSSLGGGEASIKWCRILRRLLRQLTCRA